jgi:hypothetical protein
LAFDCYDESHRKNKLLLIKSINKSIILITAYKKINKRKKKENKSEKIEKEK